MHYRPNIEGFFGTFVDNRYGQVYQKKNKKEVKDRNGDILNDLVETETKLFKDSTGQYQFVPLDAVDTARQLGWQEIADANYLKYYPHKDGVTDLRRISPIEPYINNTAGANNLDVTKSILVTPTDKIVSIRVYDTKYNANDSRHFLDIRDDESKIQNDSDRILGPILSEDNSATPNIIINYSQ